MLENNQHSSDSLFLFAQASTSNTDRFRWVAYSLLLAIVYVITANLGLVYATAHANVTYIWPPSGIALAALLIFGRYALPGIILGAFFTNVLTDVSVMVATGIALGNTLEAIVAFYCINLFCQKESFLEQTKYVFVFLFAASFGCVVAATGGMLTLYAGGSVAAENLSTVWVTWWLGDIAGILILTPFLVSLWHRKYHAHNGTCFEITFYMLMLVSLLAVIFLMKISHNGIQHPLAFILFPMLMWAAYRYGVLIATACVMLVSVFAAIATAAELGPFAQPTLGDSLLLLQTFMAVTVITTLALAVAIYERRRFEAELQESRRIAETATQAKNKFISRMSHELRTPLNAVIGFGQLLDVEKESLSEQQKECVDYIIDGGMHTLALVNDVLEFGNIEAGQVSVKLQPTSINECIMSSIDTLKLVADKQDIKISYDHSSCDDVMVVADPVRLKQVLLNLISNAIKYNRSEGNILVYCESEQNMIRVSVRDSGVGIDEDDLNILFEPFSRLYLSKSIEGTGIGLNITRHLVHLMGGNIDVKSQAGVGSTFSFTLCLVN